MRPAGFQYPGYNYSSSSHSRSVNRNTRQNSPPTPPPFTSFPISSSFENIPMPSHDSSNSLFEQNGEFKNFENQPYLTPPSYVGVRQTKSGNWAARFTRQDGSKKKVHVGTFDTPEAAAEALAKHRADMGMPQKRKIHQSSSHVGVYQTESGNWIAKFTHSNKRNYLGTYNTPEAAAEALAKRRADMGISEKSKRG